MQTSTLRTRTQAITANMCMGLGLHFPMRVSTCADEMLLADSCGGPENVTICRFSCPARKCDNLSSLVSGQEM